MTVLRSILGILSARWFWTLMGAVLLSLAIWLFGGLVQIGETHVLASDTSRLGAILVVAVLWGLGNLLRQERARRSNAAFVAALAPAPPAKAAPGPGAAEVEELGRRFQAAMGRLRRNKLGVFGGRRWLYELPWYVMIGPSGSGKTTALVQSGLRFPVSGAEDLRGTGGTRYCDWLFTDQAVLIDTAGRYVTQDSDAASDQAAWLGFLDLLRRHRPRQPLNGVLVALSVDDLAGQRSAEHAVRIRARLEEVESRLEVRLPVYLLVTKTDLVAGFDGFFERLEERDREQVWGHTFPGLPGRPETPDGEAVRAALEDLVARLDRRLPRRLAEEEDVGRRAEIFGFPAQIAALGTGLARFVDRCFAPASYERGAWLRGMYFTSGTQTGSPIDRLVDAITCSLGLPGAQPRAASGDRPFFLTRLLRDVVFAEASLVGRDPARERRENLVRAGALAGLAALATMLGAGWTWSFAQNASLQDGFAASLENAAGRLRPFGQTRVTPAQGDYLPALPALDALAALQDHMAQAAPWSARLGLSRRGALQDRAEGAYHDALSRVLLPRLVLSVEAGLRQRLGDPEYVLEGLKVYLMLGNQAPYAAELVTGWIGRDAQARSQAPATEASARRHVAALPDALATLTRWPTLDVRLIADAQETLGRVPLERRAYQALVSTPELRDLPGWKLTEHAGPSAGLTLVRASGAPLSQPIPALFTYDVFHKAILALLDQQAQVTFNEAWVLGGRKTPQPTRGEIERLKTGMLALYYDDMIARWDGLLRDVTLTPFGSNLDRTEQVTKALSGPNSPLKLLLRAVLRETDLLAAPPSEAPPTDPAAAAAAAARRIDTWLQRTSGLLPRPAQAAVADEVPGTPVSAHFAWLKQVMTGTDGGAPPIEDVIAAMGVYHAAIAPIALAPRAADAPAKLLAANRLLKQALGGAPAPVRQMLGGAGGDEGSKSLLRQQLTRAWRSEVLPSCQRYVAGRFPFVRGSAQDANLADLAILFGKGGMIDTFITGPLGAYVDTARPVWSDQQEIGLNPRTLAILQLARAIGRKLMGGGSVPKASFTMTQDGLGGAAAVVIDLDGQPQRFDTGPTMPRPFTWPGPGGTNLVRATAIAADGTSTSVSKDEGPWAFFRLVTLAPVVPPDQFTASVQVGAMSARFRLRANGGDNPFDLRPFERFACPEEM